MNKLILVGGGGHCRSVIDVIEREARYEISGIIDIAKNLGSEVNGYPVIGIDSDLEIFRSKYNNALITIGHIYDNSLRVRLFNLLKEFDYVLPSIVSPCAYVSNRAEIGEGTVVMHQAFVNTNVTIGKNCIINTKALIEHDVIVEDNCHISTSAILNGGCHIGAGSFIGSGSVVINGSHVSGFNKAGSVIK